MSDLDKHVMTINEVINETFKFVIKCKCGWVGRANTRDDAHHLSSQHLYNQSAMTQSGGIRQGGI